MTTQPTLLQELAPYRQWVIHNGSKIPLKASDGTHASVTDPNDWTDYQTASAAIVGKPKYGLGFVLTPNDPFAVIDLDATNDERIIENQKQIYNGFNTYIERSPSGKGCHIWCKGRVPSGRKLNKVELYSDKRYMTVTFDSINDVPVVDCQQQVDELYGAMSKAQDNVPTDFQSQPETQSDEQIYKQAVQAANGDLFKSLWEGNWRQHYGDKSQSEADQALYNILAFYSDSAEQVIRMFLLSVLGQRTKAKRRDIQERHIKLAFDRKVSSAVDPNTFKFMPENVPFPEVERDSEVEVKRMSEIQVKPISWIWKFYLPKGMLTLLTGPGGSGKSTVAFNIAATISNGGELPDGTKCPDAGNVLLWSSEDDADTVIVPRLLAMGADPQKVGIISTVKTAQGRLPFDPARDIEGLKRTALAIGNVSAILIDPVVDCVTGDSHRANDVRRNLNPIVELARDLKCAVIGISHFSKNSEGRSPAERVLGSTAFTDFARMVLVCAKDETSARCVFTRAKTNNGPLGGGFEYRLERKWINEEIEAQYVEWDGALEGSARDILASVAHSPKTYDETQDSKVDAAMELIQSWLQNGIEVPSAELKIKAIQHQVTEGTYRRALKGLGIVPYKQPITHGKWVCRLPLR